MCLIPHVYSFNFVFCFSVPFVKLDIVTLLRNEGKTECESEYAYIIGEANIYK